MGFKGLHLEGSLCMMAVVAGLAGCTDDAPLAPGAASLRAPATAPVAAAVTGGEERVPDLAACPKLQAPAGSTLVFHVYASGVQIYRWNGASWSLYGPDAVLSADAACTAIVGTHYVGPTWESTSGSKVVGSVLERCSPNATAVAWLLLAGTPAGGAGVFQDVAFIQRLNTAGGLPPATPGTSIGEEASSPYTTEYFFYRAP